MQIGGINPPSAPDLSAFSKMNSSSVEQFAAAAADFCTFAESRDPISKAHLWTIGEWLLLLIYHIPAVDLAEHGFEQEGARPGDELFHAAMERFSHLPFNYYRVVFDPHDFEEIEPVVGMLADDLADIYRDHSEGLDHYRRGFISDACFAWSQLYKSHWARHAVSALAAIELYRTDNWERIEKAD